MGLRQPIAYAILLASLLGASASPAAAGPETGNQPRVKTLRSRFKALRHKLGILVAPTRIKVNSDGSITSTRWGFTKDGKPIRKETRTTLADGTTVKRTLSYEQSHSGHKTLKAETVTKHASDPANATPAVITASLSTKEVRSTHNGGSTSRAGSNPRPSRQAEQPVPAHELLEAVEAAIVAEVADKKTQQVSRSRGQTIAPAPARSIVNDSTETGAEQDEPSLQRPTLGVKDANAVKAAKPMTLSKAYLKATWDSPIVHFAATTGFFYSFWHFLPWGLDAGQSLKAALMTKAVTFPLVSWHAYKGLRLKTQKQLVKTFESWEHYWENRAESEAKKRVFDSLEDYFASRPAAPKSDANERPERW